MAVRLAADALSGFLRRRVGEAGTGGQITGISAGGYALSLLAGLSVLLSFWYLNLGFSELLSLDSIGQIAGFLSAFFPPDLSLGWLSRVGYGVIETLAISAIGTLLAVIGGLFFALPAAGRYGLLAAQASRFVLNALRSVPELVWATLTALSVGLGPFAGVLALALHTTGVLGRLFAESLQNAPTAPRDALLDAGARSESAFLYGTLPEVTPQLMAYTLYRWEMNIRMAAILGFVGAGGLGQLLYFELSLFRYAEASTVIIAMLLLSIAVDAASAALRRRLA